MFDWHAFLNACATLARGEAAGVVLSLGLPGGLFLLGLVGGAVHCAGMCGPFVLAQAGQRLSVLPLDHAGTLARLQGVALLPYHLGRGTTYTALGAAAAGLLGGLSPLAGSGGLPAAALSAAALLFLVLALQRMFPRLAVAGPAVSGGAGGVWQRWLAPLFARPAGFGGYMLGLALGFLPCGLLYTALLAAGASGRAWMGAAGMAAFAMGTVPALVVVGLLGGMAGRRFRAALRYWMVPVLLLNAVLAGAMALRWLGS
ncbi:sulfite exporter TauE/SafE family protein [Ferrovibrio sp.]|uniref:sulfite exporter TauE/SafE family protein n=1 Tax=Ferrovibrio sp. TaxID=1917215 RepID=UPI00311E1980